MAGLLDYFGGQQAGLLNQQGSQVAAPAGVAAGRLRDFIGSDAAAALAVGLMSGNGNMDSMARGLAGYTIAKKDEREKLQQGDQYVRQRMAEEDRKKALNDYLKGLSGVSDEQRAYLASDPEAGRAVAADSMAPKEYKAPTVQDFYDEQTGTNYKAQWNPQTGEWDKVGGTKAPSGGMEIVTNPDGTTTVRYGGQQKLTEGQSKDVGYLTRGIAANDTLGSYEKALTGTQDAVAAALPGVGNMVVSKEYQMGDQAGREFLAAILRKDTGAAVTQQEFDLYGKMYLPRPGDGPDVLEQKRIARARALEGIDRGLGQARNLVPETQNIPAQGAQTVQPPQAPPQVDEDWDFGPNGMPVRIR
jgi:hypothetical protein